MTGREEGRPVAARLQRLVDQLSAMAGGALQWSAEARASLQAEVKEMVVRQVEQMGLATKRDVEALRARIDLLERRGQSRTARTAPPSGGRRAAGTSGPSQSTVTSRQTSSGRAASRSTSARPRRRATGEASASPVPAPPPGEARTASTRRSSARSRAATASDPPGPVPEGSRAASSSRRLGSSPVS